MLKVLSHPLLYIMSTPSVKASSYRRPFIHPRIAYHSFIQHHCLFIHWCLFIQWCLFIHPRIAVHSFIPTLIWISSQSPIVSTFITWNPPYFSYKYLNTINTSITHKWANIIHSSTSKYTTHYQHTTQHIIYIHATLSTYTTHYQHIRHIINIHDATSTVIRLISIINYIDN